MAGSKNWPYIINLGNSIIGVAVLAMPFCFKQCGIILAMLVLLFCTWLTLASCQLLMKAGIASRRRSYEFLAYFTHGATGKFLSEVGMIGMQVGTLIAQTVVIGDLGPAIISKLLGLENTSNLRTFLIVTLCLCIGLPLGLLKDLRAVSRASTVCISFYSVFILYIIFLSLPNLYSGSWYPHVHFWRPEGLFQCLPIFSFSFGCQTQLFLVYDALPEPSLKAMSGVISSAVNLCAVAYLVVGFFGYVTFYSFEVPGDILAIFPSTLFADVMKLCFVFSIVITFPVIIFPCRASIYTLLFSKKTKLHDDNNIEGDVFMSENLFKGITISIVLGAMIIAILIPNVELILGINGSIMGTFICYIFPALFFMRVMGNKNDGKTLAQLVCVLGMSILLLSTYATLTPKDHGHGHVETPKEIMDSNKLAVGLNNPFPAKPVEVLPKDSKNEINGVLEGNMENKKETDDRLEDKRREPPNPDPPDSVEAAELKKKKNTSAVKITKGIQASNIIKDIGEKPPEEVESVDKAKEKDKKQEELIHELEKHRFEQEKLLHEQRQLLKELKDHQEDDHLGMHPIGAHHGYKYKKEEQEEKEVPKADPLQEEIVNKQQEIINQQQKVIEQQQVQLDQKNNINQPLAQLPKKQSQINMQQPLVNQQQPLVNQQQPLANQQQPLVNQQQPLVNQQQPLANQQQPLVNQQQPLVNQQQPLVNQQQPLVNQQQPLVNQQQPVANQQQPLVNQQQLLVNQQQPLVNQQQPLANQQQPLANQQQPLANQQQPLVNQQQPLANQQQPLVNQQQPLANQQQPLANQQQPLVNQQQLLANQQQPLANQQQPLVNQQQPLVNQQQPLANQQQPLMNQQQPLVNQQQPLANQQQPLANQQQPLANQQQPLVNQQQPLANQQQPLMNQQQPLVNQQQPLANQQQPLVNQQQLLANQQLPAVNQQQPIKEQPLVNQQQQQTKQLPLANQQQQLNQQLLLNQQVP